MKKLFKILILLPLCLAFQGCALGPAPADPMALNIPVYEPLVNGAVVTIEVISINGQNAPGRSQDRAVETFSKYVSGEVQVVNGEPIQLNLGDDGALTKQQFESVIDRTKYHGQCAITIVLAPDFDFFHSRGEYSQQWSSAGDIRQSIKLNARAIDESASKIPFISRETFWQIVMLHELCHALAVPSNRSHVWGGRHCTNPRCILYPRVDARSALASILSLGPPLDLCKKCQAEIRSAQHAAGGKFYKPSQPYDQSEEIIRLNPNNPKVFLLCAFEDLRKRDYQGVIINCSRAIKGDPNCFEGYFLRAVANQNLKNDAKAVDDFREAIRINPSHVSTLHMFTWLLSTSPESDLRDGEYAIELATRACELTKWKNPSCLHCLAAAYAEVGNFEAAVEYETKAISLAGESKTKGKHKMLEMFKAGKPYRDIKK